MLIVKDFIAHKGLIFILFEDNSSKMFLYEDSPITVMGNLIHYLETIHGIKIINECEIRPISDLKLEKIECDAKMPPTSQKILRCILELII